MKCDVPGTIPDPSLGEQPRDGPRAARLLGVPRSADPVIREPDQLVWLKAEALKLDVTDLRFLGCRDVPETRPPRTSCSGRTEFRGDRVHRGEPLLLGVDKEYQISYRLFGRAP
jgi:hypothetical protein